MVVVAEFVGNKYRQAVSARTPAANVRHGFRMEDCGMARSTLRGGAAWMCVADGHGSAEIAPGVHYGGYECARTACATAATACARGRAPRTALEAVDLFDRCEAAVATCIDDACRGESAAYYRAGDGVARVRCADGHDAVSMHGCTLSVCRVRVGAPLCFAWVGDSVGLLVRAGDDHPVRLGRAHDATHEGERKRMRASGARHERGKSKYFRYSVHGETQGIAVSRALGHAHHPGIARTPDVQFEPVVRRGDRVIVATDGLWDCVTSDEAAKIVRDAPSEQVACDVLLARCREQARSGTCDNVLVCCHFVPSPAAGGCCAVQ